MKVFKVSSLQSFKTRYYHTQEMLWSNPYPLTSPIVPPCPDLLVTSLYSCIKLLFTSRKIGVSVELDKNLANNEWFEWMNLELARKYEHMSICHIDLVHSRFKRTQVARKFCVKCQRFSVRISYKVSLNLFHYFCHSQRTRQKYHLITAHWCIKAKSVSLIRKLYSTCSSQGSYQKTELTVTLWANNICRFINLFLDKPFF